MNYPFSKNSTWDLDNHIAIPKSEYIKSITGLDLTTGGFAIIGNVDQKIKQLTLNAKNKLYFNKSPRTRNALSYYIAYNERYNNDWLVFVAMYIYDMLINTEITQQTMDAMRPINIYNYTDEVFYEIENSTLEW